MQTTTKQIITSGPAPVGPYSPAVSAGGLIYVSGTFAQDEKGAIVGKGDVGAQTRRVLERMQELLTAAASSLDQVVSTTVYLKSAGDFQAMNDVYRTFWKSALPTRTTIIADLVLPDGLVEMSMIAVPKGAERTLLQPEGWMKSPNPYSYAIRTGDTLFLSGLISRNGRDNSFLAGDVAAQTRVIMENAGELLKVAGMSHANVVSSRVYLTDLSAFQQMNDAYRTYFPSMRPVRATVKAGLAGKDALVEITMIASSSPRSLIDDGRPANPNLSAAIRAGNRVYVSGMLGNMPDNKADIASQTRETLARIRKALEVAGCTPADVVDSMVYLPDLTKFAEMNEVYRSFFERISTPPRTGRAVGTPGFPARATVGSALVAPDGLVEIMATAVKP
jgi:reactive intermediate/imine deaminase